MSRAGNNALRHMPGCRLLCKLLLCTGALLSGPSGAGTYIFAGEGLGVDLVTHPTSYAGTGSGGVVTVRVCIDPASPNASLMEAPVQNVVSTYNGLQPTTGNLQLDVTNNLAPGQVDFESVALHEIGHCLGMAHTNLATESGLSGSDQNYTKSTDGNNNVFNVNAGADGIKGSSDDIRGDDVNMHWFQKLVNNPFTMATTVDSTTYSRNPADLPAGHNFAINGDRTVAGLLGVPNTEAVMQQGTFFDEAQRTLTHDDVATLLYAASGINETAGNSDDYTINVVYGGISSSNCDINLKFDDTETGFAVCVTNGTFLPGSSDHVSITTADIYFNTGYNWFYNPVSVDTDGDGIEDATETANGTDPNDVDTDDDGIVDGAGGLVTIANYSLNGGTGTPVDTDGDGFVDGELDFGNDPTVADFADGNIAPLGAPDMLVNAGDFVVAMRIVIGNLPVTQQALGHIDLNADGVINTGDLLLLMDLIQANP